MVKVIDTTENQYTCPRGCGPLKYGRGLEIPGKITHCKKCKGVLLTKEELRKWEKKWGINKLRSNDLINLLNSGSNGELPCPLCLNKMKELRLSYKRSRVMSRQEDAANDPKKAREEVSPDIFGAIFSIGRMIYDIKEDRAKGKLKKTVTIDGCASCSSLWLDRGEIVQIKWNDVTLEYKGETVELAGENAEPSPNVTTVHKSDENKPSPNVTTVHKANEN